MNGRTRRWLALIATPLAAACALDLLGRSHGDDGGPEDAAPLGDRFVVDAPAASDGEADASDVDADADGGAADAAAAPFCDPSDPTLLACFRFEDAAANEVDGGPQPSATGLSFAAGRVGQAVVLDDASALAMPDDPRWNVASFTLEAWVKPSVLPPDGGRAGVIDSDGRYSIFIYEFGRTTCGANVRISGRSLQANVWTHVACVLRGSTLTLYVNGAPVAASDAAAAGTSDAGTNIGSNAPRGDPFVGAIDEVRIFRAARTPEQIAAAARR
jgi:hypothetical protein